MAIHSEIKGGITFHTLDDVPWQYPVITEKEAYDCLDRNPDNITADYFAIPWATLLDMREKYMVGGLPEIKQDAPVFTVCQHIRYRQLCPLLKNIGINVCFASHATQEDIEYFKGFGIELRPFPLYTANAPEPALEKDLLYSFVGMGSHPQLISDVRSRLFGISHPAEAYIRGRAEWHYQRRVYEEQVLGVPLGAQQQETEDINSREFMEVLSRSRFSLCPSGTGPNSIRFWESLAAGSIPVLLSDRMLLPEYDWEQCILRVPEKDVARVPEIIAGVALERESEMRTNCLEAYKQFSGENFAASIRHYCAGNG